MRVRAGLLVLLLLLPLVARGQTISGTVFDIMGTPLQGIPVAYNLGGNVQQDTTDVGGNYLLTFGTSSVPDDGPVVQETTWGQVKAQFREAIPARGKSTGPVTEVLADTLYIYGGDSHWSVRHYVGTWEGTHHFNAALCPKVWTLPPYFENIDMDVATIQNALFVGVGKLPDNLHWPSGAFPIPMDGESLDHSQQMTPVMGDSAYVWSQEFYQRAGVPSPYVYADGAVNHAVNGAWVVFNDTNSFTELNYSLPDFELYAVVLHIKTNKWERKTVEHEMLRGLGMKGPSFNDPRYGISVLIPRLFNQYDAALVRFIYEKQLRNEEGKNDALLIEAFE